MAARCAAVLAVLACITLSVGAARDLKQVVYYGPSLLSCVEQNPNLSYTLQAINSAAKLQPGIVEELAKPALTLTFFAMDNQNWVTFAKNQQPPTTVAALMAQPNLVANILRNHLVAELLPLGNWPSQTGSQYAKKYLSEGGTQLSLWVDYKYTYRAGGFLGYNQVGCQLSNLKCGQSIMHVVADAWDTPSR